jgi:hypothetical protein
LVPSKPAIHIVKFLKPGFALLYVHNKSTKLSVPTALKLKIHRTNYNLLFASKRAIHIVKFLKLGFALLYVHNQSTKLSVPTALT